MELGGAASRYDPDMLTRSLPVRLLSVFAVSSALALTAASCSSGSSDESSSTTAKGAEVASDGVAGGESPTPTVAPVALGKWGHYESSTLSLDVKITKATCGIKTYKNGLVDDSGSYKDAKPDKGKQFCVVKYQVKNVGNAPAESAYPFGKTTTEDGKQYLPSSDEDSYDMNSRFARNEDSSAAELSPLNPGDTLSDTYVVSIPEEAKAVSIEFPNEDRVLSKTMESVQFSLG